MGVFTKTVHELVNEVLEKEERIKRKVSELESNIEEVKNLVQAKLKQLMEYELSNDEEDAKICRSAIKDHREQIVELQDLSDLYKNELNNLSLPEAEILKIKKAALKEEGKRSEKLRDILSQKKQAELQAKVLQEQAEKLFVEYERINRDRQEREEITKILKYIDPRAEKLGESDRNHLITSWINGVDAEIERILIRANRNQEFKSE